MVYNSLPKKPKMDEWLLNDMIARREIARMEIEGWTHINKRDLLFRGDLLFLRGEQRKELFLINVRKKAKRDACHLWKRFNDQANVYYATATTHGISKRVRYKKPPFISTRALRMLRCMR
ncbi:MAG: hypothetical protein CME58_12735 [Halieaceae bacterium]|nr:hypothetical protein [Halieaceae bacterium]|tara:strand:+ start:895 stop:1254 length:360 start_codon:yes stop_codon:yes gene_type:complete